MAGEWPEAVARVSGSLPPDGCRGVDRGVLDRNAHRGRRGSCRRPKLSQIVKSPSSTATGAGSSCSSRETVALDKIAAAAGAKKARIASRTRSSARPGSSQAVAPFLAQRRPLSCPIAGCSLTSGSGSEPAPAPHGGDRAGDMIRLAWAQPMDAAKRPRNRWQTQLPPKGAKEARGCARPRRSG